MKTRPSLPPGRGLPGSMIVSSLGSPTEHSLYLERPRQDPVFLPYPHLTSRNDETSEGVVGHGTSDSQVQKEEP